jgi:hypothetical protein
MGAESPETPRLDDDDGEEDIEEHESWRSLIQTKVDALTSDDKTADNTEDVPDESPDAAEETVPGVWPLNDDITPSRTYTDSFWKKSLDRLDLEERPITEKQNVDAMRDIAAMLDERVLTLPESMVVTEIRECLADITAQTGLSPEDTLEVVLEYTETLAMNESFQEQFVTEWAHSHCAAQTQTDDPLAQTTDNTAVSSPTTDPDVDESDEHAQNDVAPETQQPSTQSEQNVDEQQYTLDGIAEALPDETGTNSESESTPEKTTDSPNTEETTPMDRENDEGDVDDDQGASSFM